MKGVTKRCEHCGAKMMEYPHALGRWQVRPLAKLALAGGGPLNISDDLKLTKSEYTNFSKLRHWGLVEHPDVQTERGGVWQITPAGWAFVRGETRLPRRIWIYRNRVVRREEGDLVAIGEVTGGWMYRPEFARAARPHQDPDPNPRLL